jgi:hypothetical protein
MQQYIDFKKMKLTISRGKKTRREIQESPCTLPILCNSICTLPCGGEARITLDNLQCYKPNRGWIYCKWVPISLNWPSNPQESGQIREILGLESAKKCTQI